MEGVPLDQRSLDEAYLLAMEIIITEDEFEGQQKACLLVDSLTNDELMALYDQLREHGKFNGRLTWLGAFKRWLDYECYIQGQMGDD